MLASSRPENALIDLFRACAVGAKQQTRPRNESNQLLGGSMSYNVDTWKTKELVDLVIPVASLFKHDRSDWHPSRENHDDGTVTFRIMEGCNITGEIEGDELRVSLIEAYGEGSGTALHWIIEPALADSRGKLVASRVWEGGDSIDRLTVVDGNVSSEPIEI